MDNKLTFEGFSRVNRSRSYAIGHNTDTKFDLQYMSIGLAGEVGELCNLVKKQIRDKVDHKTAMMKEICDIQIYLDLLTEQLGCSIEDCLKLKWDEVSERHGLPFKLKDALVRL